MPETPRKPIPERPAHGSRRAVLTPVLRRWLSLVFVLFALLAVNSAYLAGVTALEWFTGAIWQDYFYLLMFLLHLALGLLLIPPFLVFGLGHLRRALGRANRAAVRAGLGLFASGVAVLLSGVVLTRFGFFEINDPTLRGAAYWLHVIAPFVAIWLFVLHRLAGPRIRWRAAVNGAVVAGVFVALMLGVHIRTRSDESPPLTGQFAPSLFKTTGGRTISPQALMTDAVCAECHGDIDAQFQQSAHRFSSFNNPAYAFSVNETREMGLKRDGSVRVARFCGGCHDTVPMTSGAFDDPGFDTVADPQAHAGLTCMSCHAITSVDSLRGNADYTLETPRRYPFADSGHALGRFLNRQLIKAKPEFHKATLMKPVHRGAEFCSGCHKAHMSVEVNRYKWLRGQNHYDSFLLSGVSGHRVDSFYYPPKAVDRCANCHMPLTVSDDPAARDFDGNGERSVHSHLFPAANTGLAHMVGLEPATIAAHQTMLRKSARVDLFGLRSGGRIDGTLSAPLGPGYPALEPGADYLLEVVIRTTGVGHVLTQGTADSNQLWLDMQARADGREIGRSGALGDEDRVDVWAHFVNAYVLTAKGERLDRRNGQDTFTTLYNNQIPPGAAAVVHYRLRVPRDIIGPVELKVALKYRKFDSTYLKHILGDRFRGNDLPVTVMAEDRLVLPVAGRGAVLDNAARETPPVWERWNDYGIGLLRSGAGSATAGGANKGALRQAEQAFQQVEALGRTDGPVNLARVYLREGRVADAARALHRAKARDAAPWVLAWFSAQVDRQNGNLDQAIATLEALLDTRFQEARDRGFDFSRDYRARAFLGRTLYERSRMERGAAREQGRIAWLERARDEFLRVLDTDAENLSAHHNLALVYAELGDDARAAKHRELHLAYKPDEHAAEQAVARHRRANPAADHAAEAIVIYDLHRGQAVDVDLEEASHAAR
ncbi:MAG: multiheme c-type cytochrome [Gammaproteobacteria bacterium]